MQSYVLINSGNESETSGTGLGLFIAKRLVEAMGGVLLLESNVNQGSTFSFTLAFKPASMRARTPTGFTGSPLLANTPTGVSTDSSPPLVPPISPIRQKALNRRKLVLHRVVGNRPARILIVDDAPVNCKLLTRTLLSSAKRLGINAPEIVTAKNGQIAVELFAASLASPSADDPEKGDESRPAHFNLICMDRQMPVLCGVEATRQINALQDGFFTSQKGKDGQDFKPAYIVGMSASIENSTEWHEAGVDEMLPKPFTALDIDQLLLSMCSSTSSSTLAKRN
jgi:CheY-like chemotaxis protein